MSQSFVNQNVHKYSHFSPEIGLSHMFNSQVSTDVKIKQVKSAYYSGKAPQKSRTKKITTKKTIFGILWQSTKTLQSEQRCRVRSWEEQYY